MLLMDDGGPDVLLSLLVWSMGCAPLDNLDPDGDGYSVDQGDCAPLDPNIYPGVLDCPALADPGDGACPDFPAAISVSGPWDGHYAGGPVELEGFGLVDPELSLEREGAEVPGAWEGVSASKWVFTPTAELSPATTYTWKLWSEQGCEQRTFTTSDVGLPVMAPESLVGRTYEIAIDQSYEGANIMLFRHAPFLVRIDRLDGDVASVTIAPNQPVDSNEEGQYSCEATTSVTGAWEQPRLHLAGEQLPFPVGILDWSPTHAGGVSPPQTMPLLDWNMTLVIHPDGTEATLDHLTFRADTRSLGGYTLYGPGEPEPGDGTPGNFCARALQYASYTCEPCGDALQTCMPVWLYGHALVSTLAPPVISISDNERENHWCAGVCENRADDDDDVLVDEDPECDPTQWP